MVYVWTPDCQGGPETEPLPRVLPLPLESSIDQLEHVAMPARVRALVRKAHLLSFEEVDKAAVKMTAMQALRRSYLQEFVREFEFPPFNGEHVHRALIIGCRTGEEALAMARKHPERWVVGIDKNPYYIERASTQALDEGLSNVEFRVICLDLFNLGGIPGYSPEQRPFHLVHAGFIGDDLHCTQLGEFTNMLVNVCKPGGIIQWTEMELPITNSSSVNRFHRLLVQALQFKGHAMTANMTTGITALMGNWLTYAGCKITLDMAYGIDISHGSKMRDHFINYAEQFGQQMRPCVLETGVASGKEYEAVFQSALKDMLTPTFCGICYVRTVRGVRGSAVVIG